MEKQTPQTAICVLTDESKQTLLENGGSQAWTLDSKRASECKYVVCIQNHTSARHLHDETMAPLHTAFLVAKLHEIVRVDNVSGKSKWMLYFSEYAEVSVPNVWPGHRNPIFYKTLEDIGIDPDCLDFFALPPPKPSTQRPCGMSVDDARRGLAATLGVDPSQIEIVVRY